MTPNKYLEKIAARLDSKVELEPGISWNTRKKEVEFTSKASKDAVIHRDALFHTARALPTSLGLGAILAAGPLKAASPKLFERHGGKAALVGAGLGGVGFSMLNYQAGKKYSTAPNEALVKAERRHRQAINQIEGWDDEI